MRIEPLSDGRFAILDDVDRILLERTAYEDLYYVLPIDNGSLFTFVNGTLLNASTDLAALQRMVGRAGGVESAMSALQDSARQFAPDAVIAAEPAAAPASIPAVAERTAASPTRGPAPTPSLPPPVSLPPAPGAKPVPVRAPAPARAATPGTVNGEKTLTLFLIEHNDWSTKRITDAIKGSRFQYLGVERNLEPGLDWVAQNAPDLVILDLAIPLAADTTLGGGLGPVRELFARHPRCRLVVTFNTQVKPLLGAAMRAGAHASLAQPFEKVDVLYALKTAASEGRSGKYIAPAAIAKCNLAGFWKAEPAGLMGARQAFLARSIDFKGVEGTLDARLKVGAVGEVGFTQMPHDQAPFEARAEVASFQFDTKLKLGMVRFNFKDLPIEQLDRIAAFIRLNKPKPAARKGPPPLPI